MKNNRLIISIFIGVVLIMCSVCKAESKDVNLGEGLFAKITTNRGDIIIRLEYQRAPLTVTNFIALAEGKMDSHRGRFYYDGLSFHRVISVANGDNQDFMIQGGCPQGTGMGGPGYRFPDEISPELRHDKPGVLSMANAGPGTNGSQFFITIVPTPHLDGRHTVFGHVVRGQDIVNTTRQGDRIQRIQIIRNGRDANAFRADQESFDSLLSGINAANESRLQAQRQAEAERRQADIERIETDYPNARSTTSGIRFIIQRQGTGSRPTSGRRVYVHYTGRLLSGQVFDDSHARGEPIDFRAGAGDVIQGWHEMVLDMRVGERRLVVIPPELGYGSRGAGGVIPPNAFLVFEMELMRIE